MKPEVWQAKELRKHFSDVWQLKDLLAKLKKRSAPGLIQSEIRPEREVLHCAQDFASSWMLKLSKSETRAVQPLRSKSSETVADCGCAVYWTWEQTADRLGGEV